MFPHFKRFLSATALVGMAALPSSLVANEYWDLYSRNYVPIANEGMTLTQFRAFVDYTDKMLVLQMDDGLGEISVPVQDQIVANLRLDLPEMQSVYTLIQQGLLEDALEEMRPIVYPLIKFHEVPEGFYDLHGPLQAMLDTMLRLENFEELEFVLGKIELSRSLVEYSDLAVRLMQTYQAKGYGDKAADVALTLPVSGSYSNNNLAIAALADQMRADGDFEAVIPIYRRILELNPEKQGGPTSIWLAYCLVLAGELAEAEMMIGTIQQPNSETPQFSLYQLLKGSLQYRQKNFGEALDLLTKGFVRAEPSFVWMAELLFLIGDCYREAGRFEAARSAWRDVMLLYPNSPWAERAKSALPKLPKPQVNEAPAPAA